MIDKSVRKAEGKTYLLFSGIIVGVFGLLVWSQVLSLSIEDERWNQYDFFHYFGTARLIAANINPYDIANSSSYLKNLGYDSWVGSHGIAPTTVYIFLPFVLFTTKTAWLLFQVVLLSAFFLIYYALTKVFEEIPLIIKTSLGVLLFAGVPFYGSVINAHVQGILLSGLLISLLLFMRGKYSRGSFLLGIFASLKVFTLPFILFPLFCRKYREFIWTLFGALIPWILIEFQLRGFFLSSWLHSGVPILIESAYELKQNVSLTSFLASFSFNHSFIPFITTSIAVISLVFLLFLRENDLEKRPKIIFAALSCISLVITPIAWSTYYVFLFPGMYAVIRKIERISWKYLALIVFASFILFGLNPLVAPLINLGVLFYLIT